MPIKKNNLPPSEIAEQHLLKLIESNDYICGDKIPSERDLSDALKMHRMTIRKAIERLVKQGILEKRGTSGTYIPEHIIRRPLDNEIYTHSISKIVKKAGGKPGSKLLFFELMQANHRLASHLNIAEGDAVIMFKRLRTINGLPFCIETSYLSSMRTPDLTADDLANDNSLYDILKNRYHFILSRNEISISCSVVSVQDADLLNLKKYENVLIFSSISYDENNIPIEYLKSINHPQRVEFTSSGY